MARGYATTGSQRTNVAHTMSAAPWTLVCRASMDDATLYHAVLNMTQFASADSNYLLSFQGHVGGDPVDFRFANGSIFHNRTGAGYTAGTWHEAGGEATAAGTTLWLDNAATSGGAIGFFPNGLAPDTLVIGAYAAGSAYTYYGGFSICSVAAWSAALSAEEHSAMQKGFPARRIRPQSLLYYLPLVRAVFNWRDVGGQPTENGSPTVSDHPRAYGF